MEKLLRDYSVDDLQSKENQQVVFGEMLKTLEREGKCLYAFHRLAWVLWGDMMEDGEVTNSPEPS